MKGGIGIRITWTRYGWSAHALGLRKVYAISDRSPGSAALRVSLLVYFGPRAVKNPDPWEICSLSLQQHDLFCWSCQCYPARVSHLLPVKPPKTYQ